MSDNNKTPDWDKITEGKIRHGIAVEAFAKGMDLDAKNMKLIEKWVQFIIHGYDTIKHILDENDKMTSGELKDAVIEKFDGEILDGDENEHVEKKIQEAVEGLGKRDANKVLKALKDGKITITNLDKSLDRIKEMKSA
jgi:hypothetical protein